MRKLQLIVWLFVFSHAASAQTDRGTITGTVSDATGAVIPGATIEAKNVATGAVYQAGSSETGNYTLAQLPAGTYEVSAALPGFKRFLRTGIAIQVAQVVRIDVTLEVGAATESVTVQAAAPLLKTESGEVGYNINSEQLSSLPVLTLGGITGLGNIRNPLQTVTLLPGATFSNDNTLRVNGMPSSSHTIHIDGQDATNGLWREQNQSIQPGVEAIQEMAVQTSNYDAEYGQAGGGYFNYTMKSGTNDYHGTLFDYFVNEALNAGTPFTDRFTLGDTRRTGEHIRSTQRRNNWGFNIGGPIHVGKLYNGLNKSFFFFNFEQFRETQFITNGISTVPTLAYRNGDFSAALGPQLRMPNPPPGTPGYVPPPAPGQPPPASVPAVDPLGRPVYQNAIYDPARTQTAPDGSIVRDPFPNNIIPRDRLDLVALKIQAMLPAPTNGERIDNYTIPGYTNFRHTTIPAFKIDHNFNEKQRLSGYFSYTRTRSPNANGYTQVFTSATAMEPDSYTTRLNYDQTISPTKLLHLGAGLLYTTQPALGPRFDQSQLGWEKNFYIDLFPMLGGLNDINQRGGTNVGIGPFSAYQYSKDIKPTGNVSFSWVTGNHSYKAGGELIVEGLPVLNYTRANGSFTFNAIQTSIGFWQDGRGLNSTTGFPYASFLLGRTNGLSLSEVTNTRLGNHSMAFYIQDSWKVTRKLTLNYGLRYDYATLLREQYGRMQSAAFDKPNPVAANRLGSVIYEATCGCRFNSNYAWGFGPRLAVAYQVAPKTVLRAGSGIAYGTSPNNAFLSLSVADFEIIGTPGYGEHATLLSDGNPYAPGNRFSNRPLKWPDFTERLPNEVAHGIRPPQSVFRSIDRHAGRLPRVFQWSIGIQREITPDLLVDVAYVGNRGVWWTAPLLAAQNYNALTPEGLKAVGLDIHNAADRDLLTMPISSSQVIARFPYLRNPNNVYPGFPPNQQLNQALRPYPQFLGIPPFLGPPLGNTWYDSLQAKVVQRFSRGLSGQAAFTWEKELTNGANSDTSYLTPAPPLINDVYNRAQNKQLSSFSRPLVLVLALNYTTPGLKSGGGAAFKALSWATRDWTIGGLLRYQSGELIRVPASNNGLFRQLARTDNPASWGGATTFWNRVPGKPLFLKNPNCHCIDPTKDLVLNPAAWADAPLGEFGTSAPYINEFRWQRQPLESLGIGRNFVLDRERKVSFQIRAEFQNVFNRLFLASPVSVSTGALAFNPTAGANPVAPVTSENGRLKGGYGYVNWVNGGSTTTTPFQGARPRTGQIVARLVF